MHFFPVIFSAITGAKSWIGKIPVVYNESEVAKKARNSENDRTKRKTVRWSVTFHCSFNPCFTILVPTYQNALFSQWNVTSVVINMLQWTSWKTLIHAFFFYMYISKLGSAITATIPAVSVNVTLSVCWFSCYHILTMRSGTIYKNHAAGVIEFQELCKWGVRVYLHWQSQTKRCIQCLEGERRRWIREAA